MNDEMIYVGNCPVCNASPVQHIAAGDAVAYRYIQPQPRAVEHGMAEALRRAERKLTAYVDVCSGDKELTDTVLPMVREALAAAVEAPEDAAVLRQIIVDHAGELIKAGQALKDAAAPTTGQQG